MRVRQMILAANDVRDAHLDVVENDRKVVERVAVGTQQHQVFNLRKRALLLAINDVCKSRPALARHLQTNRERFAGGGPGGGFLFR